MTSSDIYVTAQNEIEYRVYVISQAEVLKAQQNSQEKQLEFLGGRIDKLDSRIDGLQSAVVQLHEQQSSLNAKMDMLLWGSVIVIAAVTLAVTWWGLLRSKPEKESERPEKPAPAPTVITLPAPQINIQDLARQVSDILKLQDSANH